MNPVDLTISLLTPVALTLMDVSCETVTVNADHSVRRCLSNSSGSGISNGEICVLH